MVNRLTKSIYNRLNPTKYKPSILIFGASKGGESVYRTIQSQYNVIGFVDNNSKAQGKRLLRKKIYAPKQLSQLSFDKVIIASDYHVEIKKQLINELGIELDKIHIYDLADISEATYLFKLFDFYSQFITYLLCNTPFVVARYLFLFLSFTSSKYNAFSLKKITWLDQLETHKVKVFLPKKEGLSSSLYFFGEKKKTSSRVTPEVSLYRFQKGVIMTNVNAILFGDNDITIGRIPNFPVEKSQYDAGFLSSHGSKNALTKKYKIENIEKGIAITGSNDGNYYHWVIEVLSKFQFISELPSEFKALPILLSERALQIPSIKAFVECLTITQPIIYLKSNTQYEVEDLLYISPANYLVANLKTGKYSPESNFIRFESLQYLRDSVVKNVIKEDEGSTYTRIFLARKGVIRNYNQDEVYQLLAEYGFEAIYLEDLTLFEQVQLMQNAQVIVAPTGAAWTNLIFCNPNVLALCWMADEYGELTCFSDLAQFSQVKMDYLRYSVNSRSTRELYYANYSIEIEKVRQWLVVKGLNKISEKSGCDVN